jgi:hypothetical protein
MPALTLQSMLIWAAGPILQLLCVYLLYRRNLLKEFRFFFYYLIFLTGKNVFLFACYRTAGPSSWLYYSAYWVTMVLTDMFSIAVLYDIFCAAFKPFAGLQDLAKVAFKWAAVSILLIGLLVFASNPVAHSTKLTWLIAGINSFERIVRVMECALLVFLFMGSQHLGVSKRNRVFGFSLGFGFYSFVQLLVYCAAANSHVSKLPIFEKLLPITFGLSLLIWTAYLLQPEPARESLHIPVTSPLLRWNEVALAMGHTGGRVALNESEPFMPSVERMVEQVMKKEFIDRRQPRVV